MTDRDATELARAVLAGEYKDSSNHERNDDDRRRTDPH